MISSASNCVPALPQFVDGLAARLGLAWDSGVAKASVASRANGLLVLGESLGPFGPGIGLEPPLVAEPPLLSLEHRPLGGEHVAVDRVGGDTRRGCQREVAV